MKNITRRAKKNKAQFGRFALVGGINTVIDFGILFLLTYLGVPRIIANTLSTGIAFIISFFANKKYTFHSTNSSRHQIQREMILFTIVTLVGLWVVQGTLITILEPIARRLTDTNTALFIAKAIATAASMTWNFVWYKMVVFTDKKEG